MAELILEYVRVLAWPVVTLWAIWFLWTAPQRRQRFERTFLEVVRDLGPGAYGVPVHQEMERRLGRSVSIATIYVVADRLEEAGWLGHQHEPGGPERGGRAKRYWYLRKEMAE